MSFEEDMLEEYSDVMKDLEDEDSEYDSVDYEIKDRIWLESTDKNKKKMIDLGFKIDENDEFYIECFTETSISNLLPMCCNDVCPFNIITDINFNIPFLGAYDHELIDKGDMFANLLEFPGNDRRSRNNQYMVRSREIKTDITEDISTTEISKLVTEFQESTGINITDEESNSEIRNKIKDRLKNLDIRNKKIHKLFLQRYDESIEAKINMALDIFKLDKADDRLDDIIKKFIKPRDIKSHLPGYNNLLIDSKLKSELISIFGPNMTYIISGQVKCSKSMRDFFVMNIQSLWHGVDSNKKYVLNFLCSILKEVIITNNNDDWFINSISEILNKFNEALSRELNKKDFSILPPDFNMSLDYGDAHYEYEDYTYEP
jgi:hypothetical protein